MPYDDAHIEGEVQLSKSKEFVATNPTLILTASEDVRVIKLTNLEFQKLKQWIDMNISESK